MYARALGTVPDDLRTLCNYAVTIHYPTAVANITFDESGSADFPTERITVLAKGQVATLDDFGALTVHGKKVRKLGDGIGASMGHQEQLREFIAAIRGDEELAARVGRRVARDAHRVRGRGEHPDR